MLKLKNRYCEIESASQIKDCIKGILDNCGVSEEEDFEDALGGSFYVLETSEDLKEVHTCAMDGDLSNSSDAFDAAYIIEGGDYITLFLATNNAGGNSYFIPKHLWTPNVLACIEKTEKFWSSNADNA